MLTLDEIQEYYRRRSALMTQARPTLDGKSDYTLRELLSAILDRETTIEMILEHAEISELEEWANERKE